MLVFAYLVLFLAVLILASFIGTAPWGPTVVWDSFRGIGDGNIFHYWFQLRFRRVIFAAAVGAALALCGSVFQAVLRNPLAEPYVLGISSGASVGAVAAIWLLPGLSHVGGAAGEFGITASAFAGALGSILLLLGLARWGKLYDPVSLILCGVVLNAIFVALILFFYSLAPQHQVVTSLHWLMGNLDAESYLGTYHIANALVAVIVGGGFFIVVARHLDLLSLGEEEAADLGIAPRRFRMVVLVVASLVTGMVVAATGPIGFVGLVVPHIVRRIHGPSHRRLLPLSLLGGGMLLVLADTVARSVIPGQPVPAGVITALLGGPFFLVLLVRQKWGRG
ncbi:MAG: iron ABC transporter permease [Planctomycetota bacterium]